MINHLYLKLAGAVAFIVAALSALFYREKSKRLGAEAERAERDREVLQKASEAATKPNQEKHDDVKKARDGDFSGLSRK